MINHNKVSAIVLAAGQSIRFGKNKLLTQFDNDTILSITLKKIILHNFDEVIVVINDNNCKNIGLSYNLKVVENKLSYMGQSKSIIKGLENVSNSNDYIFFVADMPFLNILTINKIIDTHNFNPNKVIRPKYKNQKGNPVLFPNSYREKLLTLQGDKGGMSTILSEDEVIYVEIDNPIELCDIDTQKDYENMLNFITK